MAIARTPEEEQAVKDDLISVCATIFFRDGYANTTMKALSDEAGCTTGKFYSNFTGKPEMLRLLVEKLVHVNYDEAGKLAKDADAPLMQLIYFYTLGYEICRLNEKIREVYYYAYEDSNTLQDIAGQMTGDIGDILKKYGKNETENETLTRSTMCFSILRSLIVGDVYGFGLEDEKQQLLYLIDTILAALSINGEDAEKARTDVLDNIGKLHEASYNLIIRVLQFGLS